MRCAEQAMSALPQRADIVSRAADVRFVPILLQKSEVASVRIFGETLKREAIDDSGNLSRGYRSRLRVLRGVMRSRSDLYTKNPACGP